MVYYHGLKPVAELKPVAIDMKTFRVVFFLNADALDCWYASEARVVLAGKVE